MIFATGLHDPEGPLLLPSGEWLIVEMSPGYGCVSRLAADGQRIGTVASTGRPNGLALGPANSLWVAESLDPAILRIVPGGPVETIARSCDGIDLLWPNDLCFGLDGCLYFTDSGVPVGIFAEAGAIGSGDLDSKKSVVEERVNGRLYRLDPRTLQLECLDEHLRFPNGIAFGPDGELYVAETLTGDILRYTLDGDARIVERTVHANVIADDPGGDWVGPDGMAFDRDGRLYVAVLGQGDVTVVDTAGRVVERHKTAGSLPTNVAFGPPDSRTIYVTEDVTGQIETFEVMTDGIALRGSVGGP